MRRFAVAAALAATALACAADDPNAPLANAKEQLQALKKDEAAQKAGTQNSLKLDVPSLATPASELELPRPRRDDEVQNQQRANQKDWLLDGFDKLDRKRSLNAARRGDSEPDEKEKPLDPNDPDYFLRLYERQRTEREAKQLKLNESSASELKATAADPFAPFMKEWLANSPVREALKDVADRAAPSDPASVLPAGASPSAVGTTRALTTEPVRSTPTPNPFVQALGLPAAEPARPTDTRGPTVDAANTPLPPVAPPPSAKTIYDLPERPKMDLKQALPPPPSEDKKYFPQLKKF